MLRADVVYRIEDQANITLNLTAAPDGLTATLQMPNFSDYKYLDGYQPWSVSGFAMLWAAFAQFGPELGAVNGPFTNLEIWITSTTPALQETKPLCVISLTCGEVGGRVLVDGPVLRMTWPISEADIPSDLGGALRFVLSRCDPTISEEHHARIEVPTYSGGTSEPFVFISELHEEVQPWFVAMTKLANPKALQRHGQTATARSYADFCAGRM